MGVGVACRGATCGRGVSRGIGIGRGVGDSLPLVLALDGGRGFARSMAAGGGQGLRDSSACAGESRRTGGGRWKLVWGAGGAGGGA